MSYNPAWSKIPELRAVLVFIGSPAATGTWRNAVESNIGGTNLFVHGPWRPDYELGHMAWTHLLSRPGRS